MDNGGYTLMTQVDFYDKEQVNDLLDGKADMSSVGAETDTASESGTLWARIKYVLGHWMTRDTEQTVTGKKVFSGGAEVPTSPATATSAVNSVYVNDATDGVNNIVHKTGNEIISGIKTHNERIIVQGYSGSRSLVLKTTNGNYDDSTAHSNNRIQWIGDDDVLFGEIQIWKNPNKTTTLRITLKNSDGSNKVINIASGDVL